MFTGLVQSLVAVKSIEPGNGGRNLRVAAGAGGRAWEIGESVAVNGVCLTAMDWNGEALSFQVGPETLARTNLGLLSPGDNVNMERALRAGDPLGGHFVTGHIDGTGKIQDAAVRGDWLTVWFEHPPGYGDLLVPQGSVAVDGVSLTVVDVLPGRFSVMLIPHTRDHTTLGRKGPGGVVNLEFDLLAKHVQKLVRGMRTTLEPTKSRQDHE